MSRNNWMGRSLIRVCVVFAMMLVCMVLGHQIVYGDDPPSDSTLDAETEAFLKNLTTTKSVIPMATPEPPTATTDSIPLALQTDVSGPLIRWNEFRSDYRFANIDGSGFSAVILDTGIDLDHPFFGPDNNADGIADQIVYQYDFADFDSNASDVNGHGSNVSSIVAASSGSYLGMAPGANIIHLKVFKDDGTGYFSYTENALQWVVANAKAYHVASVNMSLGDSANYSTPISLYGLGDELAALAGLNVMVVSASGNSFYNFGSVQGVAYPAADPNSFSIGAVYDSVSGSFSYGSGAIAYSSGADRLTPFSQRHATLTTVFAPGAPITGAGPNGGTTTYHGTSQAAPHAAGIMVLMQQLANQVLGRNLTVTEMQSLIQESSASVYDGDDENDNVTNTNATFRRIDVLALGEAVLALDTTPPQVSQVNSNADIGGGSLDENETTGAAITELSIAFDEIVQNPPDNDLANDVTNPANYRLFAAGIDNIVQSSACHASQGDDLSIVVNSVTYNANSKTATLNLNHNTALSAGTYRLVICAAGAIRDLAGNSLDGNYDSNGGDHFVRNFTVSAITSVQVPILTVSKSATSGPIYPGKTLTYTLTVTNSGNVTATNIVLTDSIPLSTTYQVGSASDEGNLSGDRVRWADMSLPAGTILTRRFVVQIGAVPSGTLIINDDYGVTSFEGVRDNGKPVTTLVHNKPTIEISLFPTDSEIESSPGQTVAYTFQVINSGILSDSYRLMASGLWTITVSPTQTNKLLPEASEQVTVTVTIPSTMTQTTTNATTVTVTSAGSGASITRLLRTTATIVTSTNRKIYLPLVKNN